MFTHAYMGARGAGKQQHPKIFRGRTPWKRTPWNFWWTQIKHNCIKYAEKAVILMGGPIHIILSPWPRSETLAYLKRGGGAWNPLFCSFIIMITAKTQIYMTNKHKANINSQTTRSIINTWSISWSHVKTKMYMGLNNDSHPKINGRIHSSFPWAVVKYVWLGRKFRHAEGLTQHWFLREYAINGSCTDWFWW